ncbi:hypothetical protein PBY51_011417 [Eleginops maclovinus]|uniref:Uncharacterized protein n=1 Tax=Eleginops maclovinus TaxID=56733 RepID=A0AAN8ANV8_ELEMC|nr:hypothetical protein PBY51_011417 [Eleginops maclovinus]
MSTVFTQTSVQQHIHGQAEQQKRPEQVAKGPGRAKPARKFPPVQSRHHRRMREHRDGSVSSLQTDGTAQWHL